MASETDRQESDHAIETPARRSNGDSGIPLDQFWARLDPLEL